LTAHGVESHSQELRPLLPRSQYVASFRMISAQLCVNGNAKQADIVRTFGLTKISLKRAVRC
jgi:hypothetical protein